ncbi:glycosyltransferase [Catalinimonas sp. 4WD22]|uniref:glycosyltransferase family 2 protein n=1 Tax=Catalinimonas locisalis TaxID=3133978 RepID=UPI0031016A2F
MKSSVTEEPIFVSVIVPVYNDTKRLALCLEALQSQRNKRFDLKYEVIVIDNNSTEDVKNVCVQYHVQYLHEKKQGSYAARNKGIREAKGKYLAFTDSDCIPDPYWLENGIKRLMDNPNIGLVGGKIQVFATKNKKTLGDIFDLAFAFPQHHYVHENHFAATANMLTTKNTFNKVGLFNPNMASGGDFEWGQKVFKFGLELLYAPEAIVRHPSRNSIKAIISKSYRVNRNYNSKYYPSLPSSKQLFKYIYELIAVYIPLSQAYRKLRSANPNLKISFYQRVQLFFLLFSIHYVKTFSKITEWIKLRVKKL